MAPGGKGRRLGTKEVRRGYPVSRLKSLIDANYVTGKKCSY